MYWIMKCLILKSLPLSFWTFGICQTDDWFCCIFIARDAFVASVLCRCAVFCFVIVLTVIESVADELGRLLGEGTFGKVVDCKDLER